MLSSLSETVSGAFQYVILQMAKYLLLCSFLIALAHYMGWIHRWIWHVCESELSALLNDTPVTIGAIEYDIFRGRVWASNLLIHSPQRELWQWESPICVRIGKLYCKANILYCLFSDWILGELAPLEIDTLHAQDVQCFVERRQHIFNFYVLEQNVCYFFWLKVNIYYIFTFLNTRC